MNPPIIFCHYGLSKYLAYTLECAKISNPNKKIYLLGDSTNQSLANDLGLIHVNFDDYNYGDLIKSFEDNYKLICGPGFDRVKNGQDWIKFAFRRWFLIYNFVKDKKINKFWYFDSDVMILDDLSKHEEKFMQYDCTEQCIDGCLSGFINNIEIVNKYNKKNVEIFKRKEFIDNLDYSVGNKMFNEMDSYRMFRDEEKINSFWIGKPVNDEFFDDALCRSQGFVHEQLPFGEDVKRVYITQNGEFYCQKKSNKKLIRVITLNLSWLPVYIFKAVLSNYKNGVRCKKVENDYKEISNMKILTNAQVPLRQSFKMYKKRIRNLLFGSRV